MKEKINLVRLLVLALFLLYCGAVTAQQLIDPSRQVLWPVGCQVYNVTTGTCPAVLRPRGAYNSGTAYAVDDVVSYVGNTYINIQAATGQPPNTATVYWTLLVSGVGGPISSVTFTGSGAATLVGGVLNIPPPSGGGGPISSVTFTGSGAATLISGVLNIPPPSGGGGGSGGTTSDCHNLNAGFAFGGEACDPIYSFQGTSSSPIVRGTSVVTGGPASLSSGMEYTEGFERTDTQLRDIFNDAGNASSLEMWVDKPGVGDYRPFGMYENDNAGLAYHSNQGVQGFYIEMGEGSQGEYPILTGGVGATNVVFTAVTYNCAFGYRVDQICNPSPGSQLVDISETPLTFSTTGPSVAFTGHSLSWVKQIPTTGSLPVATAWGYAVGVNIAPDTTPDVPVTESITVQGGSGTFTTGLVCALGGGGTAAIENMNITAISGTAPTQVLTVSMTRPQTSIFLLQKTSDDRTCGNWTYDANKAANAFYDGYWYIGSIDGVNAIYGTESFSQTNQFALPTQGYATTTGANAAVHVLPSARITKVNYALTSLDIPLHYQLPFSSVSLGYNAARWTPGDTARNATYDYQGHESWNSGTHCQTFAGFCIGAEVRAGGYGLNGTASVMFEVGNNNSIGMYMDPTTGAPTGLVPPLAIGIGTFGSGNPVFSNLIESGLSPLHCFLCVDNHLPGQTSYEVFNDPWGQIQVSNGLFRFINADLSVQNDLTAGTMTSSNYYAMSTDGRDGIFDTIDFVGWEIAGYNGSTKIPYLVGISNTAGGPTVLGILNAACGSFVCIGPNVTFDASSNLVSTVGISTSSTLGSLDYLGPVSAPTGSCTIHHWQLAAGHVYYCSTGTWGAALI